MARRSCIAVSESPTVTVERQMPNESMSGSGGLVTATALVATPTLEDRSMRENGSVVIRTAKDRYGTAMEVITRVRLGPVCLMDAE